MKSSSIVMAPTATLLPYANNARTHSAEQIDKLCASIREFGFINPVLIDGSGMIIAGHGRVMAAKKLGLQEVPTILVDHLSDAQKRAYIIADNRLALDAGWDEALLRQELIDLEACEFNLGLIGFESGELDGYLTTVAPGGGLTDADAVPPVPEEPISRPGYLWILGKHRLLCGDATLPVDITRLLDGRMADLVVTDPPYNVDYSKGKAGKIQNDKMAPADFALFLNKAMRSLVSMLRPGGAVYVAHADAGELGVQFRRAFLDSGLHLSACLIWRKSHFVLGRADYQFMHEPILYGWKEGAPHHFFGGRDKKTVIDSPSRLVRVSDNEWQLEVGDEMLRIRGNDISVESFATTVVRADKPVASAEHPTMKPVDLFRQFIRNSSRRGELVLDGFGGSGTTIIAAHLDGRACAMMEIDPRFVDVIAKRWWDFTGIEPVCGETGRTFTEISRERADGQ